VRFEEILDSYLVEPPAGSGDGKAEPLSSLVPASEPPSFGDLSASDRVLDCDLVYQRAGVPGDTPLTAEKALELIRRLPEDIPLGNRRVVVRMTMETMGASARDVLTDAAAKIWALECYFRAACADVAEASRSVDERIDALRRQIDELMVTKMEYEERRTQIESSADTTIQGIRRVVEFFGIPRDDSRAGAAPAAATVSAQEQPQPASVPQPQPAADPQSTPSSQPAPATAHYDPIRRPVPEDVDLELPDPPSAGDQPSGFWEASATHKSPDTAEQLAGSFYTESGDVRKPNRPAA
jgi:hypothetical protein